MNRAHVLSFTPLQIGRNQLRLARGNSPTDSAKAVPSNARLSGIAYLIEVCNAALAIKHA
jgi:hypothetical protein